MKQNHNEQFNISVYLIITIFNDKFIKDTQQYKNIMMFWCQKIHGDNHCCLFIFVSNLHAFANQLEQSQSTDMVKFFTQYNIYKCFVFNQRTIETKGPMIK